MRAHTEAMAGPDRSNTPGVVVVVAIVGLLATIGASALGGYWANRSVERQLESERSAAIQDQRREVYVDYMTATLRLCLAWGQGDDEKLEQAATDVLNQEGRVMLIAGPDMRQAVHEFTAALVLVKKGADPACGKDYLTLRDAVIVGAEPDLE